MFSVLLFDWCFIDLFKFELLDKKYFKELEFLKDDFYVIIWLISWVFLGIYEYELFDCYMFEVIE